MYNYGLRTMYDFLVPEPGAFLIEAKKTAPASMGERQAHSQQPEG